MDGQSVSNDFSVILRPYVCPISSFRDRTFCNLKLDIFQTLFSLRAFVWCGGIFLFHHHPLSFARSRPFSSHRFHSNELFPKCQPLNQPFHQYYLTMGSSQSTHAASEINQQQPVAARSVFSKKKKNKQQSSMSGRKAQRVSPPSVTTEEEQPTMMISNLVPALTEEGQQLQSQDEEDWSCDSSSEEEDDEEGEHTHPAFHIILIHDSIALLHSSFLTTFNTNSSSFALCISTTTPILCEIFNYVCTCLNQSIIMQTTGTPNARPSFEMHSSSSSWPPTTFSPSLRL